MEFIQFRELVRQNLIDMMSRNNNLFVTNVTNCEMWDTYIACYEEGDERQSFNCNCCKSFIRQWGNIVEIQEDLTVRSIWDVDTIDLPENFKRVANEMDKLVTNAEVNSVFFNEFKTIGTKDNTPASGPYQGITWNHFYCTLEQKFVKKDKTARFRGEYNTDVLTFKRAITEISLDTVETVLELVESNSLYRGDQYKVALTSLRNMLVRIKTANFSPEELNNFCFKESGVNSAICGIRNFAIGTLLLNVEEDMELEEAVKKYEVVTAPSNYRRSSSIITNSMIRRAEEKVMELGLLEALPRRHAVLEDLTINDVLFANRETRKVLGVFDTLAKNTKVDVRSLKNVEEIPLEAFVKNVLPYAANVELLLENRFSSNFVTLTAPLNADAKRLLKWDNNFCWSYIGDVTDSIKEKVKAAGGAVDGVLRCSLSWHNYDDLDLLCQIKESNDKVSSIYYGSKNFKTLDINGCLDVDMNAGFSEKTRDAVENIIFKRIANRSRYTFFVKNFCKRESDKNTFEIEIEFAGEIYTFSGKNPKDSHMMEIATVVYRDGKFIIEPCSGITLGGDSISNKVWGLDTCNYVPVNLICYSPNYWEGNSVGTRHIMFMLQDCKNPDPVRGFYTEFLTPVLNEHRKVFEVLGEKMKAPYTDNQLSGLGFATTSRNHVFLKVTGNVQRVFKVII